MCVCVCVRYSWWIGKAGYRKRAQGLSKECAQRCMYAEFGGNVLGLGGPPLLWTKAHYICKEKSLRQLNVEADTSCCRLSRMQGFVCMCASIITCQKNARKGACMQSLVGMCLDLGDHLYCGPQNLTIHLEGEKFKTNKCGS